jgi:hypothetical protein
VLTLRVAMVAGSSLLVAACVGPRHSGNGAWAPISVDEGDLRAWLSAIAHDSMQGRAAGSIGHERAVRYLVDQVSRIGLTPATPDGGYLQRVPELSLVLDTALTELRTDTDQLAVGVDFRPFVDGRGQPRPIDGAQAIYGGVYGDTTTQIDRALVAGRIVVLSAPPGLTAALAFRWVSYTSESRFGAAAAVAIESLDLFPPGQRHPFSGIAVSEPGAKRADSAPTTIQITSRAAAALLGAPPSSLRPGILGRAVRGKLVFAEIPRPSSNVIAMLSGRGPRRGRIVVLTAHSDHLGSVSRTASGDSTYNGADDNASGSVALLAIAKALHRSRTDHSVAFFWPSAEEHGLVGSRWFVDHPTLPLDSVVAVINLDMIGRGEGPSWRRNPPNHLRAIIGGSSSDLNATIVNANAIARRPLALDTSDVYRVFCSSDHVSFMRLGVPLIFFTTDKHDDYHQVTDDATRIDFDRLRRVTELAANVVRLLGDRSQRPIPRDATAYRSCAD